MKDFFVSFTHADKGWADWISWELEAAGFTVEYQPWDFLPAEDFIGEMTKALAQCRQVVAVLSPAYFESDFATAEWQAAIASDPLGKKRRLVQVRVAEVRIPELATARIYIDLKDVATEADARERLLTCTKDRLKPDTKPGFPGQLGARGAAVAEKPPFPPAQEAASRDESGAEAPAEPFPPEAEEASADSSSGSSDKRRARPWKQKASWVVGVVVVPLLAALIGVDGFRSWALSPFSSQPEGFSSTSVELVKQEVAWVEVVVHNSGNQPAAVAKGELVLRAEDVGPDCAIRHPMDLRGAATLPAEVPTIVGGVRLELEAENLQPGNLCAAAGVTNAERYRFVANAPWTMELVVREHDGSSRILQVDNAFRDSRRFPLHCYGWPEDLS